MVRASYLLAVKATQLALTRLNYLGVIKTRTRTRTEKILQLKKYQQKSHQLAWKKYKSISADLVSTAQSAKLQTKVFGKLQTALV